MRTDRKPTSPRVNKRTNQVDPFISVADLDPVPLYQSLHQFLEADNKRDRQTVRQLSSPLRSATNEKIGEGRLHHIGSTGEMVYENGYFQRVFLIGVIGDFTIATSIDSMIRDMAPKVHGFYRDSDWAISCVVGAVQKETAKCQIPNY